MTSVKNVTAHDRWVCFGCRWTAKFPLVDIRANNRPSRLCPKCGVKMRLTGTAFRPPRSDDKEGWQVAEKLMKAGFVFASTRTRRRVPRTLADFDIWLANRDAGEVWLDEQPVKLVTSDGKSVAAVGRRKLLHREPVQIWHQGTWIVGEIRLHGDGGRPLVLPRVMLGYRRSLPLSAQSRLRVIRR